MIKIFNSNKFIEFLGNYYSGFGSIHIENKIIFLKIKKINFFKEAIIPYGDFFNDKDFENYINILNKKNIFRIRFLAYNRLLLSDKFGKKYNLNKKYTQIINLNQDLENIFKGFRATYRNEVNKYLKGKIENIKIKKILNYNGKEINKFYFLYKKTIQKAIKGGATNLLIEPIDYFYNLAREFEGNFVIYNLYKDNILINSALILKDKNGIYYLKGASNDHHNFRKLGGGRILHYEIIKDHIGTGIYDLGGINGNNLSDPITKFKIGFGGKTIEFYGGEIVLDKFKYGLFKMVEKIYNLIK